MTVIVPEGWALVPIEPTDDMIAAHWRGLRIAPRYRREWTAHAIKHRGTPHEPGFLPAWRAMVAAAPDPPTA